MGWIATGHSKICIMFLYILYMSCIKINIILNYSVLCKQVYIRITSRKRCYMKSSWPVNLGYHIFVYPHTNSLKSHIFLMPRISYFYISPEILTSQEERWSHGSVMHLSLWKGQYHRKKLRSLRGLVLCKRKKKTVGFGKIKEKVSNLKEVGIWDMEYDRMGQTGKFLQEVYAD